MSIFSIVVSWFQFLKRWNLEGSTTPFAAFTEGRLILELKRTYIATAGYWGPQLIDTK